MWTINDRLTVNAGVRVGSQFMAYLESNNVPGGPCDAALGCLREIADVDPNVAAALPLLFGEGGQVPGADVINWWNVAPRAGFTLDVTGEGRSVVKGYWGRYYNNMNTGMPNSNPGGNKNVVYKFLDQNQNGLFDGVNELGERVSGSTGTGLGIERSAPVGTELDPNLEVPHVDEFSLSAEHQIGSDLGVRASVVHKRQTGHVLGLGTAAPLNVARVGTLTNSVTVPCPAACESAGFGGTSLTVNGLPDGAPTSVERIANTPRDESEWNWTTVSVGVNRRFRSNFFWNAYFDYQWRHEARRSNNESTSPLTTDPINVDWHYSYGPVPLVQDLSNWQAKTAGRYVFPYDIGTAATLRLVSGYNWSPILSIAVPNVGSQRIFLANLDERRSDTVTILDFRVDKTFSLDGRAEIQLMLDVFNALNDATETTSTCGSAPPTANRSSGSRAAPSGSAPA